MIKRILCACALSALSVQASAAIQPIPGGTTNVELTSAGALSSLGLAVAPIGSAVITPSDPWPIASFMITGGLLDDVTGDAFISHNGSGLSLDNGATTVSLENFFIDTSLGLLTGDVSVNGGFFGPMVLFSIDPNLRLLLTAAGASALNALYGTDLPVGLEIGIADVQVIPLPPALVLFATALGGLLLRIRRA